MNVVLLSGGSGKRLWPLSNDIRSKQFIRMFSDGMGGRESMVMKVHRQLTAALEQPNIVVATSRSQVSAIRNQLGDKVSVCIEPCRRDTFPAIVLAAAYLKSEMNVADDECVVVCPVDPYVDDSFFHSFRELETLVMEGSANLTLMGIEPDSPSEKYGYINPVTADRVSQVEAFMEKPDRATAERFIRGGALWNAGVFAFRLGYLLKIAHERMEFTDYRDLFEKYDRLQKISFDYAVVEGEESIQVLRYAGQWRDIGTWNAISEVLGDDVSGNALVDESSCGVRVINELSIPVLAVGCKDMIIAAGHDGILIADREKSDSVKNYVEKISAEVRFAEKSWGNYTVLDIQPGTMAVRLDLRKGQALSYHSHEHRRECWTVMSGSGTVVLDGVQQPVQAGSVIAIPAGMRHSVCADEDMSVMEVQLGDIISAEDKQKWNMPTALCSD